MTLAEMLQTPGMYVLVMHAGVIVVDVEEPYKCHQCNPYPPFARDGILANDRWNTHSMLIIGPFMRKNLQ